MAEYINLGHSGTHGKCICILHRVHEYIGVWEGGHANLLCVSEADYYWMHKTRKFITYKIFIHEVTPHC